MKYVQPENEKGKNYFVQCVMKNKDTLCGFIDGCYISERITQLESSDGAFTSLGSDRFCDITRDDRKLRYMSNAEIFEYAKSIVEKSVKFLDAVPKDDHQTIAIPVLAHSYFHLSCNCGNYYSFKTREDIPENKLICSCGKVLLEYTNKDDSKFEYDGIDNKGNVLLFEFVQNISEEMFGDEYERNEEDDEDEIYG